MHDISYLNLGLKSKISSKQITLHFFGPANSFVLPSGSQVIREAVKASVLASTTSRLKAAGGEWCLPLIEVS